jgi:hypothetical protein
MLAPEIQETLLFLPRLSAGKAEISEKSLRKITMLDNWDEQRKVWVKMVATIQLAISFPSTYVPGTNQKSLR